MYFIFILFIFLQRWEQLVVSKLKWELSAVTPGDFVLHILTRLPVDPRTWDSLMVRRHAQTFIALSARGEFQDFYKALTRSRRIFVWQISRASSQARRVLFIFFRV